MLIQDVEAAQSQTDHVNNYGGTDEAPPSYHEATGLCEVMFKGRE